MRSYIIRKLLFTIPVLLGVFTLVFFLIHLIPGDPVDLMLGEQAISVDREQIRSRLGLDQPMAVQYARSLSNLVAGKFGVSIKNNRPVSEIILSALPYTAALAILALILSIGIAIPLGVVSAVRKDTWIDNIATVGALMGVSVPTFWGGPLLIILFSIRLDLFPVSGTDGPLSIVLPALTLALGLAGITTRMMRGSMLEVLNSEYITTARAKGLCELLVVIRHAMRNALLSVVTIIGLQFGSLLAGAVITETIFSWPGLGRVLTQAIFDRDFPVIQGCLIAISVIYVWVNLMTDLLYGVIDPRIRERLSHS